MTPETAALLVVGGLGLAAFLLVLRHFKLL